jgi:hypothetical protein
MNTARGSGADAQNTNKHGTRKFHEIFAFEVEAISRRREAHHRSPIALEDENHERDGTPVKRPNAGAHVVGLALSGGGIRSAAFCLGAMQALDAHGIIEKIDYLSTVSGGGYIGTSMTAAMSHGTKGKFPFASDLQTGEAAGVQHIRDHSNYLFPPGTLNVFSNIVVYMRGLFANVMLLLPWLLFAAAFTIWSNSKEDSLSLPKIGDHFLNLPVPVPHFGLTLHAFAVFFIAVLLWALWRSTGWCRTVSDIGPGALLFALLLGALLIIAFCELQPLLLDGMFWIEHAIKADKQPAANQHSLLMAEDARGALCIIWNPRRILQQVSRRRLEAQQRKARRDSLRRPDRDQARNVCRWRSRAARPVGGLSVFVVLGNSELQR